MNYFAHQTAAERYAQSRPYFHPLVIDKIKVRLAQRIPFQACLRHSLWQGTIYPRVDRHCATDDRD